MENTENNYKSNSVVLFNTASSRHSNALGILWGEWQIGTPCTGLWPGQWKLKKLVLAYRLLTGEGLVPSGPFFPTSLFPQLLLWLFCTEGW